MEVAGIVGIVAPTVGATAGIFGATVGIFGATVGAAPQCSVISRCAKKGGVGRQEGFSKGDRISPPKETGG